MDKSIRYKEAIKTALSIAIVYGIALSLDWMKPFWAAFTIALIALPTAGQSFNKGILRLAGTIPGCIVGILILSLAPQERWLFLLLAAAWVFFTSYMNTSTKVYSYFWSIAGITSLVILTLGAGDDQNVFQSAMFRTLETALGILVYMLVSVFVWPRTNIGAIVNTSSKLLLIQKNLFAMLSAKEPTAEGELDKLRAQQLQLLVKLDQDLQAEGSESYEVNKNANAWMLFRAGCFKMMEQIDKWYLSVKRINEDTVYRVIPEFDLKVQQLSEEFQYLENCLKKEISYESRSAISIEFNKAEIDSCSHLERIRLNALRIHFNEIAALLVAQEKVLDKINNNIVIKPSYNKAKAAFILSPAINYESIKGAAFASLCIITGFLIWIFIDPPGHQSWYMLAGALGITVAGFPQLQAKVFILPLAITCAFGISINVFVLPLFDAYWQLGLLLFVLMFINCFFFNGLAQLSGSIGIINMIGVTNPQMYSFALLANSYLFLLMGFGLVYIISFVINSPRPEKALLSLVGRYFKSSLHLLEHMNHFSTRKLSIYRKWHFKYHLYQLKIIPKTVAIWGMFINKKWFPEASVQQAKAISDYLLGISYRMEELVLLHEIHGGDLADEWHELFNKWQQRIAFVFSNVEISKLEFEQLNESLKNAEENMENAIENMISKQGNKGNEIYEVLSGYIGISNAAIEYASIAKEVEWSEWRNEYLLL